MIIIVKFQQSLKNPSHRNIGNVRGINNKINYGNCNLMIDKSNPYWDNVYKLTNKQFIEPKFYIVVNFGAHFWTV